MKCITQYSATTMRLSLNLPDDCMWFSQASFHLDLSPKWGWVKGRTLIYTFVVGVVNSGAFSQSSWTKFNLTPTDQESTIKLASDRNSWRFRLFVTNKRFMVGSNQKSFASCLNVTCSMVIPWSSNRMLSPMACKRITKSEDHHSVREPQCLAGIVLFLMHAVDRIPSLCVGHQTSEELGRQSCSSRFEGAWSYFDSSHLSMPP